MNDNVVYATGQAGGPVLDEGRRTSSVGGDRVDDDENPHLFHTVPGRRRVGTQVPADICRSAVSRISEASINSHG